MQGEREEGWEGGGDQDDGPALPTARSRTVSREEMHASPVHYEGDDDSALPLQASSGEGEAFEGERGEDQQCYSWDSGKEERTEGPAEEALPVSYSVSREAEREACGEGDLDQSYHDGDEGEGPHEDASEGCERRGEEGMETGDGLEDETRRERGEGEGRTATSGEAGDDSSQIDKRKVFVGNTPLAVRDSSVEGVFGEFGKLSGIKIFKHFLHLTYDDPEAAKRAIEELNDKVVWGAQIVVEPLRPGAASQRPPGPAPSRSVVLAREDRDTFAALGERGGGRGKAGGPLGGARRGGRGRGVAGAGPGGKRLPFRVVCHNLDPRVHWQDLKDFGREAGEVNFTNVLHNQDGLRIGIIEYCSQEDMETALRELNGRRLFDARVEVRREEANASYPSFAEISSSLPPDALTRPASGRAASGSKGASRTRPLARAFPDDDRGAFPRGRRSAELEGGSGELSLPRSSRPALPPALTDSHGFAERVSPRREALPPAGFALKPRGREKPLHAPAAYPAVLPLWPPRRQPGPDEAFEPFMDGPSDAGDARGYPGEQLTRMLEGDEAARSRDARHGSCRDERAGLPYWRPGVGDERERDALGVSSRDRRDSDEGESGRPRRCFYVDGAEPDSAGHAEKGSVNGRLHAREPDGMGRGSHFRDEEGEAHGRAAKRRRNDFEFVGPPAGLPAPGDQTVILPPPSGVAPHREFAAGAERLRRDDLELDLARSRRERDAAGDKGAWRGRAKGPGSKALDAFPNGVFGGGSESKHAAFRYAERGRDREVEPLAAPFRPGRDDPRGLPVAPVRGPGGDFRDDWRRDAEGIDPRFPPVRPHGSDRLDPVADAPSGRERGGRAEEDSQRRGEFGRDLDRREVPFDERGQSRRETGLHYEPAPRLPLAPRKWNEKGGRDFAFPMDEKPRHIYAADDSAPLAPGLSAGAARDRDAYLGGDDLRRSRRGEHMPFLRRDHEEERRREARRGDQELLHEDGPRVLEAGRRRSVSLGHRRLDLGVDGARRDRGARPEHGHFGSRRDQPERGDSLFRDDRERDVKARREEAVVRDFRGAPAPGRGPERLPVQRPVYMYDDGEPGRGDVFPHPLAGAQYPPQFGGAGLGTLGGKSLRREDDRKDDGFSGHCDPMPRSGRGDSAGKGYSHLHPLYPTGASGRNGRCLDRPLDESERGDGRGRAFFERDPEVFRSVRGREGADREYVHVPRQREDMRMERPYALRDDGRRCGRGGDRGGDAPLGYYRDDLRH